MSSRRTRDRQLAKLAARRAAERARKRRQRIVAATVAIAMALAGIGFFTFSFLSGGDEPNSASATPSASPSVSAPAGAVACGGKVPDAASKQKPQSDKAPRDTIDPKKTYMMTMVTSCGTIKIKLDPKSAPKTVNSLVFLAKEHFFDGLLFHRTVSDFVVQGGDPLTVQGNPPEAFGTGGPGYKTTDPPPAGAKYPQGTVAMAKGQDEPAGTSGSQFFIVTGTSADAALAPGGEGLYAIVGTVTEGLDVALQIEKLPRQQGASDGRPAQDVYIEKVTVKVS